MSNNDSARDDLLAQQSRAAPAGWYAAAVFGAVVGSAILRVVLHRIFPIPRDGHLRGPVVLALVLGLLWFALAFLVLARSSPGGVGSTKSRSPSPSETRTVLRTIIFAFVVACVIAITAWVGLYLTDTIFYSRSLPWIAPLITVQDYGFGKASQMFPCQAEGFDTGCEAYKWIPTFLIANSFSYFCFVLLGLFSWRHSEAVRRIVRAGAHAVVHWSVGAVTAGLVALQVMHGLNRDTHDSLYPHPGIAHWHFGVWEQINDLTGTLITVAGLSLPVYLYRAFRRTHSLAEARTRMAEATSLLVTLLVALILGDVY